MKKLIEIPFNHELIGKEGIVVKDRKGNEYECFVSKKAISAKRTYCIFSFDEDGDCSEHTINGKFDTDLDVSDYDLIMYKEIEEKEPRVIYALKVNEMLVENVMTEAYVQNHEIITKGLTKFIEVIEEGE